MKQGLATFVPGMAVLAAGVLAGCAGSSGWMSGRQGPSTAATAAPASGPFYGLSLASGASAAGSATAYGDDSGMCAMHREMQAAPSEEARRALEERHLGAMAPAQRREQLEMMRRDCQ